ncbi:MAG: hypothetical protein K0R80_204 [Clostridia bacterium]|jgi:hypothetical protein|nr:hypothetical protein [Clostridia bacterium]MDF2889837.1 hypothetical protein [Clostridia bacterium]
MKNNKFLYHFTKPLLEFMICSDILTYVEDHEDA